MMVHVIKISWAVDLIAKYNKTAFYWLPINWLFFKNEITYHVVSF